MCGSSRADDLVHGDVRVCACACVLIIFKCIIRLDFRKSENKIRVGLMPPIRFIREKD